MPSDVALKGLILAALKDLHGEMESVTYLVDVLSWDPASGKGQLRVAVRYGIRMFSCLFARCRRAAMAVVDRLFVHAVLESPPLVYAFRKQEMCVKGMALHTSLLHLGHRQAGVSVAGSSNECAH